jgi:hypothetical protein
MSFTPIPPDTVFGRQGGSFTGYPENGTAYLQVGFGGTLSFAFTNGTAFDMVSIDLAEYSTVLSDPTTVQFIGYRHDGTIVTTSFTTDGVIDGTGPLRDFQTFTFGSSFTDLVRVEIPSSPWSLDNLAVSIPEPSTPAVLFLGGLLLAAWRAHMKRYRAGITPHFYTASPLN